MSTTAELLDIAWILVCAALVMLMQAGFSCLVRNSLGQSHQSPQIFQ